MKLTRIKITFRLIVAHYSLQCSETSSVFTKVPVSPAGLNYLI